MDPYARFRTRLRTAFKALALAATSAAAPAHASFLSGEALDTAANVLSIIVIIIVPVVAITVFWLVHVLPEKIAHKRHHPQKDAIQTLCLLSLVFGGLLWPLAWIWAYTKPVFHKMAYGTDKHDEYYEHLAAENAADASGLHADVTKLRTDLDALVARGDAPPELAQIRDQLATLEPRLANPGKEAG
jgi:CBS domain containing-hemolysin-like protein